MANSRKTEWPSVSNLTAEAREKKRANPAKPRGPKQTAGAHVVRMNLEYKKSQIKKAKQEYDAATAAVEAAKANV